MTHLSIEDDNRPAAACFNAVQRTRWNHKHSTFFDGDRRSVHDEVDFSASNEESFRMIVTLAGVNEALRSAAAAIEAKAQQMQSELLGGLGLPGMEE